MTIEPLSGATEDFAAFVEPHLATLSWLAACLAPGEHEDLVQRALTRAWHRRSRFDPGGSTDRAWLCTFLVEEFRRVDRRPGVERRLELVVPPPPGGGFIGADPVDLGRALESLEDPLRRAVEYHHLAGLTPADTGVVMGCAVDQVGSALGEAHLRLHRALLPTSGEAADGADGDRGPAADRWIDALLRTGGAQFRAEVPPAVFDRPSSRMSMLGPRARLTLLAGIAAAVVGIVVAGTAIVRVPDPSVAQPAAAAPGASESSTPSRPRPTAAPSTSAPTADVGPAARVVGMRPAWPSSGLIEATASTPGAAGGVRMGWEVASGDLLVGIPERLLCNDKQIRLRLDSTSSLNVDLYGGIGADQGCSRGSLRVMAFAPLAGQNDGESVVRVTGTTGALLLPGLSGLELHDVGTEAALPSVSSVRTIGASPDVDVHWQPETGRLLVSARGCGAYATADLGNGAEVTVVIFPTGKCTGRPEILTHVIQIPPHPAGSPLSVVVYNNTADRSATTDVFSVPATALRPSRSLGAALPKLTNLSAAQKKLTGIDRIGRTADNDLYFEVGGGPGGVELRVPTAQLVSNQTIVLRRGTQQTSAPGPGTIGAALDIPSVSDVHRPLVIRIGDEDVVLPGL